MAVRVQVATLLDWTGWPMSMSTLHIMRVGLVVIIGLAGVGVSAMGASVLLAMPEMRGVLPVLVAYVAGYAVVPHGIREQFTARRVRLTAHPQAPFFRALDIPQRAVIVSETWFRVVALTLVVAGAGLGALGALLGAGAATPTDIVTLLVLPVSAGALLMASSCAVAAWSKPPSSETLLGAVAKGFVLGVLLGSGAGLAVRIIGSTPESAILPP